MDLICGTPKKPSSAGFFDISFFDLLSAVRIEEGSGNVDDRIASPLHDKSLRIGDISNNGSFEIFFCCELDELLSVFASDDDSHSFLGFGNSKLCSVKAFILLRYLVEIDIKAVSQFAYSDGYAACAEIVAAFDEARNFAASEEALDLFSVRGLPFCTSAPQVSMDSVLSSFEEPVAPPMPSRPVRPPTRMTTSPGSDGDG